MPGFPLFSVSLSGSADHSCQVPSTFRNFSTIAELIDDGGTDKGKCTTDSLFDTYHLGNGN